MIYLDKKITNTARALSAHGLINPAEAMSLSRKIWEEARYAILSHVSPDDWAKLSMQDKTHICARVIQALCDKKKLMGFLSGERKHLI